MALDKIKLENEWASALLNKEQQVRWDRFKAVSRVYMNEGNRLVVWVFTNGKPEVTDVYTVERACLNFEKGVSVLLGSEDDEAVITHEPQLLPYSDVFVWIPNFSELRWTPQNFAEVDAPKQLTLTMCVKTESARHLLTEGTQYAHTEAEFLRAWPTLRGTF